MYGLHLAELITDKILAILDEFKINHKIIALITDNGSNMITYSNQLALELERKFNNFIFSHYKYAAYIINFAIKIRIVLVRD